MTSLNLEKIIEILVSECKNNNNLIKYVGVAIIFFYFVEGWSLYRLFLFGLIFVCVVIFFTREKITKPTKKIMMEKRIDKPVEKLMEKKEIVNTIPEVKKLPDEIKKLTKYIGKMKKMSKDSSYNEIIIVTTNLFQEYIQQIEKLFMEVDEGEYPHLTYQKVRDLEKELSIQIESLNFKVAADQYIELGKLIDNIENEMENINRKLEQFIEDDYKKNPSYTKGPVYKSKDPRPFDDQQDIDRFFTV